MPSFDCTAVERPLVDLTGSHRGQPVNVGSRVQLVCVPVTGRPDPVLTVSPSAGFSQPADTRFTTNDDGSVVVDIPRLSGDVCFNCVGVNPAGTHSDEECISVLGIFFSRLYIHGLEKACCFLKMLA